MANNKIVLYQKNTKSIPCVVVGIADVSGYIPYLTVKSKPSDTIPVLSSTGVITDASGSIVFTLSSTDTSIVAGDYVYDITIEKSTQIHTIVKNTFTVLEVVR